MEQIGYSLIDAGGNEITAYGNIKGQLPSPPAIINLPNHDRVHCPAVGGQYQSWRLVERWLDDEPPSPWHNAIGRSIAFDGSKTIVTVAYEETPSIVPVGLTAQELQLELLRIGKLDEIEAAMAAAGGTIKIGWKKATAIERSDALATAIAEALGYDSKQMDELFRQAASLSPVRWRR
jgi:hypothetical protein